MNSASKPAHLPPNFAPCAIVHSRAQAELVLSFGLPATLLSARGAALAGGVGWWQALVRQARAKWPNTVCADILDCADAPGMAMAALRLEQKILVLDGNCPAFAAVAAAVTAQNAHLLPKAPQAIDMASRTDARNLLAHLNSHTSQMMTLPDRDRPDTLR